MVCIRPIYLSVWQALSGQQRSPMRSPRDSLRLHFDTGFKLVWLDSTGPITDGVRALAQKPALVHIGARSSNDPGAGRRVVTTSTSAAGGSSETPPFQAWRLDVLSLCRPLRQAIVALGDFEHFASRDRIKYFRSNSTSVIGSIVPMRWIVRKLLGHCRTLIGPTPDPSRDESSFHERRMNIR
jgi:hypothetical protein